MDGPKALNEIYRLRGCAAVFVLPIQFDPPLPCLFWQWLRGCVVVVVVRKRHTREWQRGYCISEITLTSLYQV